MECAATLTTVVASHARLRKLSNERTRNTHLPYQPLICWVLRKAKAAVAQSAQQLSRVRIGSTVPQSLVQPEEVRCTGALRDVLQSEQ
eukprot:Skav222951  [mRNA]  locus=scaffold1489:684145:685949:+ [translate_table: standard]